MQLEKEITLDRFNVLQIYSSDNTTTQSTSKASDKIYIYLEGIELSSLRYVLWGYSVYQLQQEEFMRVLTSQPMNSRKTLEVDYNKAICRLGVINCENPVSDIKAFLRERYSI